MSWLKKGILVQKMVRFMSELSQLEFTGIGSLYEHHLGGQSEGNTSPATDSTPGEVVLPMFFVGDNIQLSFNRGP